MGAIPPPMPAPYAAGPSYRRSRNGRLCEQSTPASAAPGKATRQRSSACRPARTCGLLGGRPEEEGGEERLTEDEVRGEDRHELGGIVGVLLLLLCSDPAPVLLMLRRMGDALRWFWRCVWVCWSWCYCCCG